MNDCASWIAVNKKFIFKYLNKKNITKFEKEEIYQDLVIKALISGKNIESPLKWSIRVCQNLVYDLKSESKKYKKHSSLDGFEIVNNVLPDRDILAKEFESGLLKEIESLTKKQKEAVLHRMDFDKRATDCSQEMGLNYEAFKVNLKLGRAKLRLFLNSNYDRMNESVQNNIFFIKERL